jgi:hypothetical protein
MGTNLSVGARLLAWAGINSPFLGPKWSLVIDCCDLCL